MVKYAIDCEMVASGNRSILARVSVVNESGQLVLDSYVKPTAQVTDYRTAVSGIQRHHLDNGEDFNYIKNKVSSLLRGNILIGHSLKYDLEALGLEHPDRNKRDLALYRRFLTNGQPTSLKELARIHLGLNIQTRCHDSAEDAKAAMKLYSKYNNEWEASL